MDYLDTSLLVAALTNEARTREIQDWLAGKEPDQLAVSHWVVAEFSAALSIKLRTGRIGVTNRADALAMFNRLVEESFSLLHIGGDQFLAHLLERECLGVLEKYRHHDAVGVGGRAERTGGARGCRVTYDVNREHYRLAVSD